mmetsp:Transcript_31648/g.41824  ORF Transcript_31648/g.41824 Transcript_31648/m.41824 type:complete len:748 (-) Transcript_31648:124-2367(-)
MDDSTGSERKSLSLPSPVAWAKKSFKRKAANIFGRKKTKGADLGLDDSHRSSASAFDSSRLDSQDDEDMYVFPALRKGNMLMSTEQKSWREKYFALSGLFLRYRKRGQNVGTALLSSESGATSSERWGRYEFPLKGAVLTCMEESVEVADSEAGERARRHCFVLENNTVPESAMKWILSAYSEEDKNEWIAALSCNIEAANSLILEDEIDEKETLAKKMAAEIDIKSRQFHFRIYPWTFLGEDAVAWLATHLDCSPEDALFHGNELCNYGFFYHVLHEHSFTDGYFFFRFCTEITNGLGLGSENYGSIMAADIEEIEDHRPTDSTLLRLKRDLKQMSLACSGLEDSVVCLEEELRCTKQAASASVSQLSQQIKVLQLCLFFGMGGTAFSFYFSEGLWTLKSLVILFGTVLSGYLLSLSGMNFSDLWGVENFDSEDNPFHYHFSAASMDGESKDQSAQSPRQQTSADNFPSPIEEEDEDIKSLPPVEEWITRPVFARMSPWVQNLVRLDEEPRLGPLPINTEDAVVPFENDLFRGRVLLRFANMPTSPADYFNGRSRLFQVAVQGEFKKRVRTDQVLTGQCYRKPFVNLPARWLIRSGLSLFRRLSPALQADLFAKHPIMLSPLISTSQTVMVERHGMESPVSGELEENTTLLGGLFTEGAVPASARKRFFSKPRNLQQYYFEPGLVYTFDFYQHMLDVTTLEINLGFRRLDISRFLNRQPVQAMAKLNGAEVYFWNVEIWHEKLIAS